MIESADDLRRVMHYVDATELNEGDFLEVSVQVLRALEAERDRQRMALDGLIKAVEFYVANSGSAEGLAALIEGMKQARAALEPAEGRKP